MNALAHIKTDVERAKDNTTLTHSLTYHWFVWQALTRVHHSANGSFVLHSDILRLKKRLREEK